MKQRCKRLLAILLALALLLSVSPAVFAENPEDEVGTGDREIVNDSTEWIKENDLENVYVKFMPASITLEETESLPVEAIITGNDGTLSYSWQSDDTSVASVSGSGAGATIRANSAGSTSIKLTVTRSSDGDTSSATLKVTVKAAETPVKAVIDGDKTLSMTAGSNQGVSVTASGGSGSYTYNWEGSDNVGVDNTGRDSSTIYARFAGTGHVTLTVSDTENPANYTVVTWTVTVTESKSITPLTAKLDKSQLTLSTGESATLTLTASGGSGDPNNYAYYWGSDNTGIATVSGTGSQVTVTAADSIAAGGRTAQISAVVVDTSTNTTSETAYCLVTVKSSETTYNTSASATVGSNLGLNMIAQSIANEYASKMGVSLPLSASVHLDSPSGTQGVICLQDGTQVKSNVNYSLATMQDMYFKPTAGGTFATKYTITDGGNIISGTISISVSGGASITNVTVTPTTLTLECYSSHVLSLSVTPSNAAYTVTWSSNDTKLVNVNGNGSTATVTSQGRTGKTTVVATVTDSNGNTITKNISVTVYTWDGDGSGDAHHRVYSPNLTVTIGSDYYGTSISDNLAKQWRNFFGVTLGNNASVRFTSLGTTRYGMIHLSNGTNIKANTYYTFNDLINMYFEPYAVGSFSIPYVIEYKGDMLGGNIQIQIRATSLDVTINPANVNITPYSSQYIRLNVNPGNAYYRVAWSTSNSSVATVRGDGAGATITAAGKTGTATITATITDASHTTIYRSCTVKVSNGTSTDYNPTVYTTLGVNYTGTGTADAIAAQFRSLYNTNLDANKANIRFSSTGNNNVGVLHLSNGTAVKANLDYSFAQYAAMYLEPVSSGTFRIPYTLTYNGKILSGTAGCVVNSGGVNCTLTLPDTLPCVFSKSLVGGTGGVQLSNTITNAVGSSWTYVRFTSASGTVGNLYQNDKCAALNSGTNITAQAMNQLYFVPNRPGTFTAAFTVYNNSGKLADGTLKIVVPGSASGTFTDVPAGAYYADAVTWAIQREVTTGTSPTTFSPANTVTRAQAVTFLWRAMGRPNATGVNPFTDVAPDEYYTQAVLWAVQQGITAGTSETTFSPEATLTQDQMLTFLCRASGANAGGENWSELAVSWAAGNGLFVGLPGAVTPKGSCPRSDVVYYLWKDFN